MTDLEKSILNATDTDYDHIIRGYKGNLFLISKRNDNEFTPFFMYNHMFTFLQPESGAFRFREPVIDSIEKSYLENMIRPFKDEVLYIEKYLDFYDDFETISIMTLILDEDLNKKEGIKPQRVIHMPPFRKGTMYKNMELNRKYTLKELELFT